ncbi:MAG TPA: APC family permease [Candidatus Acidoferrales bacterium]|jgi:amino acid transporter|nr:APC family permease [Candidatus Acidoferrales bacterium]
MQTTQAGKLERGLGLKEASALNMIDMVGIGPFIVIPLVIADMGGPQCLLAWAVGAIVALVDGCLWAELGAAMPEAGGSYVYLREAYGPAKWGRLLSFLVIWQTIFQGPLVLASGSIGFAEYFTYLVPLGKYGQKAVAGAVVITLTILLYRRITTVGKISMLLWIGVFGTIAWLITAGATHFHPELAFTYPAGAWKLNWLFFAGLGSATVPTIYSYWGYYNVCFLGGEVKQPERNIPRAIFISIIVIAILYLAMQTCVLGVVPWQEAQHSQFIVSIFFERIYGTHLAKFATLLILWIAFASLFSAALGYSRIPYAAAQDGNFFAIFGRVHPTKKFPHISLLALCAVAFVFSLLFKLATVIAAILAMRILVQFVGQAVGIIMLRRKWASERFPFKMWLYPIPAGLAIILWLVLFVATGWRMLFGVAAILAGVIVFLVRSKGLKEWPFAEATR